MRRTAALLLLVAALAGCGGSSDPAPEGAASAPADGVRELANVLDLRSDFEADAGKTRVIILLSPT